MLWAHLAENLMADERIKKNVKNERLRKRKRLINDLTKKWNKVVIKYNQLDKNIKI